MLIVDDDAFSTAEMNSVYTIRVDCGRDQETEFALEIVQDCHDNEIAWTTALDEIVYYPVSQSEELVRFGYTQTIPGCKVSCQYNPTDCNGGMCYVSDFSTELQQFYIRKDMLLSASEKHDSIVCTSEQNQRTISNEFVIKFDFEDADILNCKGETDTGSKPVVLGRGSGT
jgi:hypothetical protein